MRQYKFTGQLEVDEVYEQGRNVRKPIHLDVLGRGTPVTERHIEFSGTFREITNFVEANEAKFERIQISLEPDRRIIR